MELEEVHTRTRQHNDEQGASAHAHQQVDDRIASDVDHPLSPNWPQTMSSTEATTAGQTTHTHAVAEEGRIVEGDRRIDDSGAPVTAGNAAEVTNGVDPLLVPPPDGSGENEAISVRTNMLRSYWDGYTSLTKFRRWILILRLLIGLAQVVAGVVVLALPTSLGDSFSYPETCDPEGMFVYLLLHVARVACSIPIDVYLGLSPHRSPRARRRGAEGLLDRERNRRVGSLHLDRKMGRLGDLLGFCHVVLFIVGNYVTWTSVECSHPPADSQPLFFTSIAMLSITYLVILEVALMVLLVIFFLPLLIAILNALGLSHRLPQRDIHPETGKIGQDDIEKHSKIIYYTPMVEEASASEQAKQEAAGTEQQPSTSGATSDQVSSPDVVISSAATNGPGVQSSSASVRGNSKRARFGRLIGLSRQQSHESGPAVKHANGKSKRSKHAAEDEKDAEGGLNGAKHPFYPIPSHRATCPICLSDYEDAKAYFSSSSSRDAKSGASAEAQSTPEVQNDVPASSSTAPPDAAAPATDTEGSGAPELLRLLRCGHVMHKACVDQWLTAVSGRCPVCQRPVIEGAKGETLPRPPGPQNGAA